MKLFLDSCVEFMLISISDRKPGVGFPGGPDPGPGVGPGDCTSQKPGPGDFCFQNPGVFGVFFKRFLSEKWEIRGTIFTFSTKKLLVKF